MMLLALAAFVSTAVTSLSACRVTDYINTTSNSLLLTCECQEISDFIMRGVAIRKETDDGWKQLLYKRHLQDRSRNAAITRYRYNGSYGLTTLRLDLPKKSVSEESYQCVAKGFRTNGKDENYAYQHRVSYEKYDTTVTPSIAPIIRRSSTTTTTKATTAPTTAAPTTTATTTAPETTTEAPLTTEDTGGFFAELSRQPTKTLMLFLIGFVFLLLIVVTIPLLAYFIARRRKKSSPSSATFKGDIQRFLDVMSSRDTATRDRQSHDTLPPVRLPPTSARTPRQQDHHGPQPLHSAGHAGHGDSFIYDDPYSHRPSCRLPSSANVTAGRPELALPPRGRDVADSRAAPSSPSSTHIYDVVEDDVSSAEFNVDDTYLSPIGECPPPAAATMSDGRPFAGSQVRGGASSDTTFYTTPYGQTLTKPRAGTRHNYIKLAAENSAGRPLSHADYLTPVQVAETCAGHPLLATDYYLTPISRADCRPCFVTPSSPELQFLPPAPPVPNFR